MLLDRFCVLPSARRRCVGLRLPLGCGMDFLLLLLILVLFTRILGCSDATPRKIEGMLGVLELQFSISLVLRGRD